MSYNFTKQHGIGLEQERILDAHFRNEYRVIKATREHQREGIDRWFVADDSSTISVEYKADFTAAKTGNAFIETVSVDTRNVPGWAYTSKADVLVYYVPPLQQIYNICLTHLRENLTQWAQTYPLRSIPNNGYQTHGLLVPLKELRGIAYEFVTLP